MSATPFYKPLPVYGNNDAALAQLNTNGETTMTTTTGLSAGATHFVELPIEDAETCSVLLRWYDATISATVTLEVTNMPATAIGGGPVVGPAANDDDWAPNADVTITGPAGAAEGSEMVIFNGAGIRRARLRIVIAANGSMAFWPWGND